MINVILIVADTWRKKDFIKSDEIAPFLTEKAEQNIFLNKYYSNAPWTVPAHASLFSGELPSEHRTTTQNLYFNEENALADYFSSQGFQTEALTENMLITESTGFDRGFDSFKQIKYDLGGDTWKEVWEKDKEFSGRKEKYTYFFKKAIKKRDFESVQSFGKHVLDKFSGREADFNPVKSRRATKMAEKSLKEEGDKFVFLNLMSIHAPYTFEDEERQKFFRQNTTDEKIRKASQTITLEDYFPEGITQEQMSLRKKAYKASINYTDKLIERMYEEAPEETLFMVIGDHGELIGEYSANGVPAIGHHLGTYKELIEVPCIIFGKGDSFNLDIDEDAIYDHTSVLDIFRKAIEGKELIGKEIARSEYYGRKGFLDQFGKQVPEGFEEIYSRKSFSLLDPQYKYDLTSDGEYLWSADALTEDEELEEETSLKQKAEIFYSWAF